VVPRSVAFMLRDLTPPNPLTPIRTKTETQVYRLAGVQLRKMKRMPDGDIHLVIRDPGTKGTMIVEFPHEGCLGSTRADASKMMKAARRHLRRRCGRWPGAGERPKKLRGTATIDGVAFFDRFHAKIGGDQAPNGIELHPVLAFTHARSCRKR